MSPNSNTHEQKQAYSRRQALAGGFSLWALLAVALAMIASGCNSKPAATESAPQSNEEPSERRVILVTGSTSGLGREVALRLASTGSHIIVHGRNRERGLEVVNEIEREGIGSAKFYAADLASFEKVREFGETILRDYDKLDVLINNAGIHLAPEDGRQISADGHELTFAVNYLSGFLLTRMLLPRIIASAPSRIVNVSSRGQMNAVIDFNDVMLERNYDDSQAYRQSKLAQVMFTFDLARELEGTGVIVSAVHPASMMPTPLVLSRFGESRATVEDGVEAVVNQVNLPDLESGQYFDRLSPERANDQAYDEEARETLRKLSIELTGVGSY
jgi:NAD(P)-dependent dehydrogenase (short-subunit alcohol dehydrogenase family)